MSEITTEMDKARELRESLKEAGAVNRSGRVFLGTVLLISAVGLWVIPVDAGDDAMRLMKLLFSSCLLALGAMFIFSAAERSRRPEFQVDMHAREIRVVRHGSTSIHKMDELIDVTLKDQLLSARSRDGQLQISLPVPDKRTEIALRRALFEAA